MVVNLAKYILYYLGLGRTLRWNKEFSEKYGVSLNISRIFEESKSTPNDHDCNTIFQERTLYRTRAWICRT